MSRRRGRADGEAMLELWRPTKASGVPIGCLASTYRFQAELFDEQCLGRFLDIESDPDREDLAYLLEREHRLESVYSGVLVDQEFAGIEHSLRWDVLPVRIRGGIQHSKVSVLAWHSHVRLIVSSANLTEAGYRSNQEATAVVDLTPDEADRDLAREITTFLRALLSFVPAGSEIPPSVSRARTFLDTVERMIAEWKRPPRDGGVVRRLVVTLPEVDGQPAQGSLLTALQLCQKRGGLPYKVLVASPFYDDVPPSVPYGPLELLASKLARDFTAHVVIAVPCEQEAGDEQVARLRAPRALLDTKVRGETVKIRALPTQDSEGHGRPWHAKLIAFEGVDYNALLLGSANFTTAGLGTGKRANAEAGVLYIDHSGYKAAALALGGLWSRMEEVERVEEAEWLGPAMDDADEHGAAVLLPEGFVQAEFTAGPVPRMELTLDPKSLPASWEVFGVGLSTQPLLDSERWAAGGCALRVSVPWDQEFSPKSLLVRWEAGEAIWLVNVTEPSALPAPPDVGKMSADELLRILAASDPGAAFRAWATRRPGTVPFEQELDAVSPVDLDPLRRFDISATFLHVVRRRARALAVMRRNLEEPVWSAQALESRLCGVIGVQTLADRYARELMEGTRSSDEVILAMADLLIVLSETQYRERSNALPLAAFEKRFRAFLGALAERLDVAIAQKRHSASPDVQEFWKSVLKRCAA